MKNVIVIYDDTRKPGPEISAITGKKSYGNTIFKRRSLMEWVRLGLYDDIVERFETSSAAVSEKPASTPERCSVFKLYSDQQITDTNAVRVLLEKSTYAKENYTVFCNGRPAAVIYPDMKAYMSQESTADELNYEKIESNTFADLSDPAVFRGFITSGFDARFFNALAGDE